MIFGLYAFTDRFGNWSQPFLAHDNDEACAMIIEGLKGKQLSYAEKGKSLYLLAHYNVNNPACPLVDDDLVPISFVCDVDKLIEEEKGSADDECSN